MRLISLGLVSLLLPLVLAGQAKSKMYTGLSSAFTLERYALSPTGRVFVINTQLPGTRKPSVTAIAEPAVQMPLEGKSVTSSFGWRLHPIFRRRIFHDGVDFSAEAGDKVHSIMEGQVQAAGPSAGYGNAVFIYHPSTHKTSMYAHLSKVSVLAGQKVHAGTIIGLAGSTGFSTGVHLHFGVKSEGGTWIDPIAFVHSVKAHDSLVAVRRSEFDTKSGGAHSQGQTPGPNLDRLPG